jgi:hypothetical protein
MYLRAEQRKREELAASEVTGIMTPLDPVVYDHAPIGAGAMSSAGASAGPSPAVATPASTISTLAPIPVVPRVVDQAPAVRDAESPAPAPSPAAGSHTVADTPATPVARPAGRPIVSRRQEHARRALIPATALGTVAIAATFGIAGMFWPSSKAEAPAVAKATAQQAQVANATARQAAVGNAPAGQAAVGATKQATVVQGAASQAPVAHATAGPVTVANAAADPSALAKITATSPAAPRAAEPATPASAQPQPARVEERRQPDVAQVQQRQAQPRTARPTNATRAEAAAAPARSASEGLLRITSSPSGARVTVNGIGWGQTPVTVGHLPLGTKTVRVTSDGYTAQQRLVDLRGDSATASVHITLQRAE